MSWLDNGSSKEKEYSTFQDISLEDNSHENMTKNNIVHSPRIISVLLFKIYLVCVMQNTLLAIALWIYYCPPCSPSICFVTLPTIVGFVVVTTWSWSISHSLFSFDDSVRIAKIINVLMIFQCLSIVALWLTQPMYVMLMFQPLGLLYVFHTHVSFLLGFTAGSTAVFSAH